jgi:hypothetical protein
VSSRKALRRYPPEYWTYLLHAPISVQFSTLEAARAFRRDFYNFRQALRLESQFPAQILAAERLTLRLSSTTVHILPAHFTKPTSETPQ